MIVVQPRRRRSRSWSRSAVLGPGSIAIMPCPKAIALPHHVRHAFGQGTIMLFAFPQRLLRRTARGNIMDDCNESSDLAIGCFLGHVNAMHPTLSELFVRYLLLKFHPRPGQRRFDVVPKGIVCLCSHNLADPFSHNVLGSRRSRKSSCISSVNELIPRLVVALHDKHRYV